jgi:hypothetical protein
MVINERFTSMTREEVDKLIEEIKHKVDNGVVLSDFEILVIEAVKLTKRENRNLSIREIEDYKFWMD